MITVIVLMPVFRRHRLANNAVACFLANILPADVRADLVVIDDGDTYADMGFATSPGHSHHVHLWKTQQRFPTLAQKYGSALDEAISDFSPDIVAIFEDDDIYLPWHLGTHIETLRGKTRAWSKPSRVWSDYRNPGHWELEPSAGRFHASIAFTADVAARWPDDNRADFDQRFMAALEAECGPPLDPLSLCSVPGYCFRWRTGTWHAQHWMSSSKVTWYDRANEAAGPPPRAVLVPEFDDQTRLTIERLSATHHEQCS
jgi:hypothetical protein